MKIINYIQYAYTGCHISNSEVNNKKNKHLCIKK